MKKGMNGNNKRPQRKVVYFPKAECFLSGRFAWTYVKFEKKAKIDFGTNLRSLRNVLLNGILAILWQR